VRRSRVERFREHALEAVKPLTAFKALGFPYRLNVLWLVPASAALAGAALVGWLQFKVSVVGPGSLLDHMLTLKGMLVAFYVGILGVLIALPDDANLAQELKGVDPASPDDVPVTLRRFMLYLFGYLSYGTLVLFLAGLAAQVLGGWVHSVLSPLVGEWYPWVRACMVAVYLFAAGRILSTTFFGIYMLAYYIPRNPAVKLETRPPRGALENHRAINSVDSPKPVESLGGER